MWKEAGCVKQFDQLSKQQLEQELRVREVFDFGNTKKELTQSLKAALQGVQRVPTALLNDPMQTPSDINLKDYTILDCEPLHDLKGHLKSICLRSSQQYLISSLQLK